MIGLRSYYSSGPMVHLRIAAAIKNSNLVAKAAHSRSSWLLDNIKSKKKLNSALLVGDEGLGFLELLLTGISYQLLHQLWRRSPTGDVRSRPASPRQTER